MTTQSKIFSQEAPTAGNLTTLYVVPSNSQIYVTIYATNKSGSGDKLRIQLIPNGLTPDDTMWLIYDLDLYSLQPIYLQQIAMNAGDQILVYCKNGYTTFNVTGTLYS